MIHNIDPVAFTLLGFPIRWYGIAYILGFLGAYILLPLIEKRMNRILSREKREDLLFGTFLYGVIGGRLGHFLFYNPSVFWTDFIEIFMIHHGGMSIHGGLIGGIIFLFFFAKKEKKSFFYFADILIIPLLLGLFFGRIANFINAELVGIPTNLPWAVIFSVKDGIPRHPTQIYEALKNILLLIGVAFFLKKTKIQKQGTVTSIFLIGYGVLRFGIEFYKEAEHFLGGLNTAQWLCIAMIVSGMEILKKTWKNF